ncbi:YdcF family protein [Zavarzinia compransoris]|uniref:YdcF family protein n=1 Tax=Zavarzinia marina TaxID=2911065 RepID=UPI001F2A54A8|nr:YdcF family protein [Zavarzinia marina]MCF4167218.1 YdcF family protein [Zavarzinia marina]
MFFIASKIFWLIAAPFNLACLLGILAVAAALARLRRTARGLAWGGIAVILLAGATPIGPWATAVLDQRFPMRPALPGTIGGIIVLGGAISNEQSIAFDTPVLAADPDRVTALLELARRFPEAPIIWAGGYGGLGSVEKTEAWFARDLYTAIGFDVARITFEPHSRNTHENEVEARKLAGTVDGAPWILVTGAVHMPRSVAIFRHGGWNVLPWPVAPLSPGPDTAWEPLAFGQTLELSTRGLREWIGLVAYRLAGYTDEILPD